jgi:hypothetical protein
LTREIAVHNLKIAELRKKAAACRNEAKECMRAKPKRNEVGARNKLLEVRRCETNIQKREMLVQMCRNAEWSLDEEATTFSTVQTLMKVQRHHKPDSQAVAKVEDAIDSFREMQLDAHDVQTALEGGLRDGTSNDELQQELDDLLSELDQEDALGFPNVSANYEHIPVSTSYAVSPPETHVIGTPALTPLRSEGGVVRRGAPGPDGQPITA